MKEWEIDIIVQKRLRRELRHEQKRAQRIKRLFSTTQNKKERKEK